MLWEVSEHIAAHQPNTRRKSAADCGSHDCFNVDQNEHYSDNLKSRRERSTKIKQMLTRGNMASSLIRAIKFIGFTAIISRTSC